MADPVDTIDSRLDTFVRRMPKAEIHIHLEGSVRPSDAAGARAAERHPPAGRGRGRAARVFPVPRFPPFHRGLHRRVQLPAHATGLHDHRARVGEDAAAQNIRYLEIHFNPETNVRKRGLDFHAMLDG